MTDGAGQEPPPDRSGEDIDLWGDGSETRSTPIPDWWDRIDRIDRINDGTAELLSKGFDDGEGVAGDGVVRAAVQHGLRGSGGIA